MNDPIVQSKQKSFGPLAAALSILGIIVIYFGSYAAMVDRVEVARWSWPVRIVPIARYHMPFRAHQQLSPQWMSWADWLLFPAHWFDRQVRRTTWQSH